MPVDGQWRDLALLPLLQQRHEFVCGKRPVACQQFRVDGQSGRRQSLALVRAAGFGEFSPLRRKSCRFRHGPDNVSPSPLFNSGPDSQCSPGAAGRLPMPPVPRCRAQCQRWAEHSSTPPTRVIGSSYADTASTNAASISRPSPPQHHSDKEPVAVHRKCRPDDPETYGNRSDDQELIAPFRSRQSVQPTARWSRAGAGQGSGAGTAPRARPRRGPGGVFRVPPDTMDRYRA